MQKMGVSTARYEVISSWLQKSSPIFVFLAALGELVLPSPCFFHIFCFAFQFLMVTIVYLGPPPTPKKIMVVIAGCAHVGMHIFAPMMFIGRMLRFLVIGWVGREYGQVGYLHSIVIAV